MTNLVTSLSPEDIAVQRFRLRSISPDDGKYAGASEMLVPYLSPEAEWRTCALIQKFLLETRKEFGQAEQRHDFVKEIGKRAKKEDKPLIDAALEDSTFQTGIKYSQNL
ncbi:hypothetical protein HY490_03975 [Candidatus Woesearchaeota archaeon]|nr:hypothetical protein [Candidatus Woesearchaeota archaeon]